MFNSQLQLTNPFQNQFLYQNPQSFLSSPQQSCLSIPQYLGLSIPNSPILFPSLPQQLPILLNQQHLPQQQQKQQYQLPPPSLSHQYSLETPILSYTQSEKPIEKQEIQLLKNSFYEQPTTPLVDQQLIQMSPKPSQETTSEQSAQNIKIELQNDSQSQITLEKKSITEFPIIIQQQPKKFEKNPKKQPKNQYKKVSVSLKNKNVANWYKLPEILPISEEKLAKIDKETASFKSLFSFEGCPWFEDFLKSSQVRQILDLEEQNLESIEQKIELFSAVFSGENIVLPQMPKYKSYVLHKKNHENNKLVSKFHNKNKLFINTLLRFFSLQNLEQIQMPPKLRLKLHEIIDMTKKTGITYKNKHKIDKTDMFNHSHYRLLFFQLGKKNFGDILNQEQDIKWLKNIMDFDIQGESVQEEDLLFVNFLKRCMFEIVNRYLRGPMVGTPEQQKEERLYEVRAFLGLEQMVMGNFITKF